MDGATFFVAILAIVLAYNAFDSWLDKRGDEE